MAVTLGGGGIGLVAATSPADAVAYVPITPCRLADTRPGQFNVGPRTTPLGADDTHTITATDESGECTEIPSGASGVQINVTAVGATAPTFLTVWATGNRPTASSLNPSSGQGVSTNAVTTKISPAGQFRVYNRAGAVHVVVDAVGYYTDHDHDDRYYAKAEVDALIDASAVSAAGATDGGNEVDSNDEVITSVELDTSTTGTIIANATTSIFGFESPAQVQCSITPGNQVDDNFFVSNVGTDVWATLAGSRAIDVASVPGSGTTTVNLVCEGTGPNVIGDSNLTAVFVPDT